MESRSFLFLVGIASAFGFYRSSDGSPVQAANAVGDLLALTDSRSILDLVFPLLSAPSPALASPVVGPFFRPRSRRSDGGGRGQGDQPRLHSGNNCASIREIKEFIHNDVEVAFILDYSHCRQIKDRKHTPGGYLLLPGGFFCSSDRRPVRAVCIYLLTVFLETGDSLLPGRATAGEKAGLPPFCFMVSPFRGM